MFGAISLHAQIRYLNEKISINGGDINNNRYGLAMKKIGRLSWHEDGSYLGVTDRFLEIDLLVLNPRIYGTGDKIVFYNTNTNTFNSIQVANVYQVSDSRMKENIKTMKTGLNTILNLHPVSYTWKQLCKSEKFGKQNVIDVSFGPSLETQTQYGFLAQEVEELMPEAVSTDEEGIKSINYTAFIPMLVQAVQELQLTVYNLESRIEELEKENNSIIKKWTLKQLPKIEICEIDQSKNNLTVSLNMRNCLRNAHFVISSITGIYTKRFDVTESRTLIDISDLSDGMYSVTLYVDGQYADSRRLIK